MLGLPGVLEMNLMLYLKIGVCSERGNRRISFDVLFGFIPLVRFGQAVFIFGGRMKRIGVIGIIIEDRAKAQEVNNILGSYGDMIIGRMGVPHIKREQHEINVISLIVEGTSDEIGGMAGKIGNIRGVQIKTALANK